MVSHTRSIMEKNNNVKYNNNNDDDYCRKPLKDNMTMEQARKIHDRIRIDSSKIQVNDLELQHKEIDDLELQYEEYALSILKHAHKFNIVNDTDAKLIKEHIESEDIALKKIINILGNHCIHGESTTYEIIQQKINLELEVDKFFERIMNKN